MPEETPQTERRNDAAPVSMKKDLRETEPESLPGGQPHPEEERPYGALKCYFYTPRRGDIRGAFCLLFDGRDGKILENVFWVTLSTEGIPPDIHESWREFNRSLPDMGPYEKPLGDKMIALLLEVFTAFVRTEIFSDIEEPPFLTAPLAELRRNYERMTHYFLEFEAKMERLSRRKLIEAGVLEENIEDNAKGYAFQTEDEKKSFAGTLVTCLPIIDPVRGTPVTELRPGDLIEVKIQGGVGASGLIRQYLMSTSQEAIFPVETVEMKAPDKIYVFLNINEEIRGLLTLTKDLRLRTLRTAPRRKAITVNMDNVVFFGTLVVAVVVILLVVRHLFF